MKQLAVLRAWVEHAMPTGRQPLPPGSGTGSPV